MRRRGYNLLEILAVLGIMSILMATALASRPGKRPETIASANQIGEYFRQARQLAVNRHEPVGVGLATDNGARSLGASLYRLQGWRQPSITEQLRLEVEHPGLSLFSGYWTVAPPFTWEPNWIQPSVELNGFNLSSWSPPNPKDPLFVYLPSGSLVSNQPAIGGSYCLVVGRSLTYSTGSLGGAAQPQLQSASPDSATIQLSGLGAVKVTTGVYRSESLQGSGTTGELAGPLRWSPPAYQPPNIERLEILPKPPTGLPAGIDAVVKPDGFLTFQVQAQYSVASRPRCYWQVSGGSLSAQAAQEMNFEQGHWLATWEWAPPPGSNPGDKYRLTCRVEDDRGGSDQRPVGATGTIEVIKENRILFVRPGTNDLATVNEDGHDRKSLSSLGDIYRTPAWAPDGSKIFYPAHQNNRCAIYTCGPDGAGCRPITSPGNDVNGLAVSPDGVLLAYYYSNYGTQTMDVHLIRCDGSHPDDPHQRGSKLIATSTANISNPLLTWHPGGDRLIFSPKINELAEWKSDGSLRTIYSGGASDSFSGGHFSSEGSKLYFTHAEGVKLTTYEADYSLTGPLRNVEELRVARSGYLTQVSPDGTRILTIDYQGLHIRDIDGNNDRLMPDISPVPPQWSP